MTRDQVAIDADGRQASGRGFLTLADEYAQFATEFRSRLGTECPLPYEEISGPYLELMGKLLDGCEQLGSLLRDTGGGQVVMADRNVVTEHVNTVNVIRDGQVQA
ncbi:hypothetical protein [Streptosporangium roseum]|uniref:hypothetical protein n=1 Tax=Streptosporangium roseum TaxID=2001 RepID=UPI00331DB601